MTADAFWKVIAAYNQRTELLQLAIAAFLAASVILAWKGKPAVLLKIALGISHLFIGIVFFYVFGTEPIQHFFAGPLFIAAGILFLYDAAKYPRDEWTPLSVPGLMLLILILLYPAISFALGHRFPAIVVYVMPCPMVSLAIVLYSQYSRKNIPLLILLVIWGLTGVKSLIFAVPEDLILLASGFYGIFVLITELRRRVR